VTLGRHIKAVHGITAVTYRAQYPGAHVLSEAGTEKRKSALVKAHAENSRAGQKKTVVCPCGLSYEVGRTSAVKDPRCSSCRILDKAKEEEAFWATKTEGLDYVICVCGHKAENLTSHIRSVHPELVGCYPGRIIAERSAVRDKTALKGLVRSAETRAKMSAGAGWNRGLTKETDPRVANAAAAMKGRPSWSKGLTPTSATLRCARTNLSQTWPTFRLASWTKVFSIQDNGSWCSLII